MVSRQEKYIQTDIKLLNKYCEELNLDNQLPEEIYRRAVKHNILRGRYIRRVMASVVYLSARKTGIPLTIQTVSKLFNERRNVVQKLACNIANKLYGTMPYMKIEPYIEHGLKRLNIPFLYDKCMIELENIRNDISIPMRAAISIFVTAQTHDISCTMSEVAEAIGINPETMRIYVYVNGTLKESGKRVI